MAANDKRIINVSNRGAKWEFLVDLGFGAGFDKELLNSFKEAIPQELRGYDGGLRIWRVGEDATKLLEVWAIEHDFIIPEETARTISKIYEVKADRLRADNRTTQERLIEYDGASFTISFPYSQTLVRAVKAIPGRRYNSDLRAWIVSDDNDNLHTVKDFALAYNFKLDDAAKQKLDTVKDDNQYEGLLKGTLFPFQEAGERFIRTKKRVLLGDEMGTGKTIQIIAAFTRMNAFPCLIVCPKKLVLNWRNEWQQWTDKRVHVVGENSYGSSLYKTGSTLTIADVYIVNYEGMGKLVKMANKFKAVAYDEAHYLKNPKAKRTKTAFTISSSINTIVAATGTPVVNNVTEIHTLLTLIDQIDNIHGFHRRFVNEKRRSVRQDNLKKLHEELVELCFMRREKKDVLPELPDKIRQRVYVPMDDHYEQLYKQAQADLATYLRKEKGKSDEQVAKSMRNEVLVGINYMKQITAHAKIDKGAEIVEQAIEDGEKVVLFCHHQEVLDKLMARFSEYNPVKVDGSITDPNIIDNNVRQFQNNENIKVIICTIKAAGVGLTLTAASRVYFFEMGWTPADMDQAEDRCHRNGAKNTVYATYFMAEGTIDNRIFGIIERKRTVADLVTGNKTKVEQEVYRELVEQLKEDNNVN